CDAATLLTRHGYVVLAWRQARNRQASDVRAAGAVLEGELDSREILRDDDRLLLREAVVIQLEMRALIAPHHVETDAQPVARDNVERLSVPRRDAAIGDVAEDRIARKNGRMRPDRRAVADVFLGAVVPRA